MTICVLPQELLPLPYRFPFIIFHDFDHDDFGNFINAKDIATLLSVASNIFLTLKALELKSI